MKRNLIIISLLLGCIYFSFAQENLFIDTSVPTTSTGTSSSTKKKSIMTYILRQEIERLKALALNSQSEEIYVDVMFFPKEYNSNNVDMKFFVLHNIEYRKSESFMRARIPIALVDEIEEISGVYFADIPEEPRPLEVVSEGRSAIGATKFVLDGVDGRGVKIAVIDFGFKDYDALQRRGELPNDITTKDFTERTDSTIELALETTLHGSACAEIICDIAPRSQIFLLKINDIMSFQSAYNYCVEEGINIISCSVGWPVVNSFIDGSGIIAKLVDNATESKILSVVAAGNEGNKSCFLKFQPSLTDKDFTIFPSGEDYLSINILADTTVYFVWNDFVNFNSFYEIWVYDKDGKFISSVSNISGVPIVKFQNKTGETSLRLKIYKKSDSMASGREMRLCFETEQFFSPITNPADRTSESSLSTPGDSRMAVTVGAIDVVNYESGSIASYSSRGPTRSINELPEVIKPDIVAPSGVTTVSYGVGRFGGTSAATPHVAGAAALLLSLSPSLSNDTKKFKEYVISFVKQVQSSPDNTYGQGKLVLNTDIIPFNNVGDFVCYPNPVRVNDKYIKITNLPFNSSMIDVNIYTVTGEFVKSFNANDLEEDSEINKVMIKWDLRNQSGEKIVPGVYFVSIKTLLGANKVKKIAVMK